MDLDHFRNASQTASEADIEAQARAQAEAPPRAPNLPQGTYATPPTSGSSSSGPPADWANIVALLARNDVQTLEKPPKYAGHREKDACRIWLSRMNLYLQSKEAMTGNVFTELQTILQAATFLEKEALDWFMLRWDARETLSNPFWATFKDFSDELRTHFGDIRNLQLRRDEWDNLTQTKSVNAFLQKIQADALYLDPKPTEYDQMRLFKKGLKAEVRRRVESVPDRYIPDSFLEFAEYADKCERELILDRGSNYSKQGSISSRSFKHRNHGKSERNPQASSSTIRRDADGDIEMTLNAAQARKETSWISDCRARKACFGCGSQDHRRADCPDPRKLPNILPKPAPNKRFQGKGNRR